MSHPQGVGREAPGIWGLTSGVGQWLPGFAGYRSSGLGRHFLAALAAAAIGTIALPLTLKNAVMGGRMSHPQCVGREAPGIWRRALGIWGLVSRGIDPRDLVGIFWLLWQPLRLGQSPSLCCRCDWDNRPPIAATAIGTIALPVMAFSGRPFLTGFARVVPIPLSGVKLHPHE